MTLSSILIRTSHAAITEHLEEYHLHFSNCTNINIFISSIDLFARMNTVYGRYFGASPPSRACVAVDLPHPIRVRLACTAFIEPSPLSRQALHVQGLSYWAPANIGPYSQAILVRHLGARIPACTHSAYRLAKELQYLAKLV